MVDKRAQNLGEFIIPLMGGGNFRPVEVNDDIEVSEDPHEVTFVLDKIPGAPDAQEIIVEPDGDDDVIEVSEDPEDSDVWKWEHHNFLPWLSKMFSNVPSHSGHDTTGLEKAIAYFETLDREISKAMRTDFKDEIDLSIGFTFNPLEDMNEAEQATARKIEADTDAVLIDRGVIDPSEARERIARQKNSAYAGLDLNVTPAPPEEDDEEGTQAIT